MELQQEVASHDTAIWRVHAGCGASARTGAIVITGGKGNRTVDGYTRCLAAQDDVEECRHTG